MFCSAVRPGRPLAARDMCGSVRFAGGPVARSGTGWAGHGTEIGYLSLGAGPALLCTHGAFSSGAEWLPVAQRVIAWVSAHRTRLSF